MRIRALAIFFIIPTFIAISFSLQNTSATAVSSFHLFTTTQNLSDIMRASQLQKRASQEWPPRQRIAILPVAYGGATPMHHYLTRYRARCRRHAAIDMGSAAIELAL